MIEEFKYKDKVVGKNEKDEGSLKNLVNEEFKNIERKNGVGYRDDQEIRNAGRNICNKLIKEIQKDKSKVYGSRALEPLTKLVSNLKAEYNKMKGMSLFTNNEDKINQVAQRIDNAENETLKRLAKNRTTQDSRDIVKKGNEIHKDKPMFLMEGGKDIKKQTGNIIFTEASNPVKIHDALKGLFTNPNIVYEIDYSECKNQKIKDRMTGLIGTQTCYLRYDKDQKTYTIRDKDGNGILDRAYIWEGVKLIPAGVRQRSAYVEQKKENENLGKFDDSNLNKLTNSMLKDIPSAGNLTPTEQKDLALKTENRITELLKKAKKLGYELDPECITTKWFGNGHMELHLNSGSSEVSRTIRGNDGDYNKVLGEKLDKFVDNNEGDYKTYLTKRVKAKWQELESLTKTETTNLNKKGQQNLTDKEKELAESHKQQVLYGIGLLEKMIDNYRESEGDSWDNDDRDLVQIKKLIRNAKASINDSNNLDDNAIINNFINPIWGKWASIKRITKNINNGQGQIYENPAYKEQYNQLKNVFLGEKTQQISAIRSLGGHGRLFDKTETSFLAEEIEGNEDLTIKNADIKESIKNIKTRLPDSIFDKNGNIIQKRKEQFDKMFVAAAKGTDALINLLVNSKMLPKNWKDEEDEVKKCVDTLKNQLNEINKQSEGFTYTISTIRKKEHEEKLSLEQKTNKSEEDIKRLQVLTYLENNPNDPAVKDSYEKTIQYMKYESKYGNLGNITKSCLFPALAELGGGAEGTNADIYNDIKGYGVWNLSDENAKYWSEEIIEDIIVEVVVTAVAIALSECGAGEAIYVSFRVAKASAKAAKGIKKMVKGAEVFSKTLGKKIATQYAGKFSVKSAKAAKEIAKVSHIATSTDKGINIVKRSKDFVRTIRETETIGSLSRKLALKGTSMIIEGTTFHINSTIIHNAIEGKSLGEGLNPFGYTEGPNGEKISNFRNYAQSIAFLGVLKTIGKPIQGLTGNMAKGIFGKYYDTNWLTKMAKNIVSMTGEMGSMMGTDQILSLTFDQKFKPVTAEDLVSMFGMVAGLRLTNKVNVKIQEYDRKSVTIEMRQGDNTFNVKIDREGNVIKIDGKDINGNKIQNPQEILGIKAGVEGQNLRETHDGKEVGTVKGSLKQLNNLHEGDIITVKHGENDVKFRKNKDGNREIIDAGKIENDRFKAGEEYIVKENQDGSGYHLETKIQGGPKISLDGKVGVKLGTLKEEITKTQEDIEQEEFKKREKELEDINKRVSELKVRIKEIEKQISEIENNIEIPNRKIVAKDISNRRMYSENGNRPAGNIPINEHYEGKIVDDKIQIIDKRTGKTKTINFNAKKKINDLLGNDKELEKLDIEIAERMILGIKYGHIEVENIEEALKIKNGYSDKNLEIVGLENGNYGVRKKTNIRKLRQLKTELNNQLEGLKSEYKNKKSALNREKKSKEMDKEKEKRLKEQKKFASEIENAQKKILEVTENLRSESMKKLLNSKEISELSSEEIKQIQKEIGLEGNDINGIFDGKSLKKLEDYINQKKLEINNNTTIREKREKLNTYEEKLNFLCKNLGIDSLTKIEIESLTKNQIIRLKELKDLGFSLSLGTIDKIKLTESLTKNQIIRLKELKDLGFSLSQGTIDLLKLTNNEINTLKQLKDLGVNIYSYTDEISKFTPEQISTLKELKDLGADLSFDVRDLSNLNTEQINTLKKLKDIGVDLSFDVRDLSNLNTEQINILKELKNLGIDISEVFPNYGRELISYKPEEILKFKELKDLGVDVNKNIILKDINNQIIQTLKELKNMGFDIKEFDLSELLDVISIKEASKNIKKIKRLCNLGIKFHKNNLGNIDAITESEINIIEQGIKDLENILKVKEKELELSIKELKKLESGNYIKNLFTSKKINKLKIKINNLENQINGIKDLKNNIGNVNLKDLVLFIPDIIPSRSEIRDYNIRKNNYLEKYITLGEEEILPSGEKINKKFNELFKEGNDSGKYGIQNINQTDLGYCYAYTGFELLKKSNFFDVLIKTSMKETTTGWEIKLPLGDPNGHIVKINKNEINEKYVLEYEEEGKKVTRVVSINSESSLGFKVLEIAFIKEYIINNSEYDNIDIFIKAREEYKNTGDITITEELLRELEGGKTSKMLEIILGKNIVKTEHDLNRRDSQQLLLKFINNGNIKISTRRDDSIKITPVKITDGNHSQTGEIEIFGNHAYSIERTYIDNITKENIVVIVNPHNTSEKIHIKEEDCYTLFPTRRVSTININNLFK